MAARDRSRVALVLIVAIAFGGLAAGCGTKFTIPTEIRGKATTPGQSTYQLVGSFQNGMQNIQDVLLTPGGELFLVFQDRALGRGTVLQYPLSADRPLSTNFPGLLNPTAICSGANRVFILDQGDSSSARSDLSSFYPGTKEDSCGYLAEVNADVDRTPVPTFGWKRPITNLGLYWHVNEYLLDGTLVTSFTDTNFVWVSGVAADAEGRVYVAGVIVYCRIDPYSPLVRTLEYRYRIRRYEHGSGDRFVVTDVGPDPLHPLQAWRRDPTYVLLDGTGIGSAKDPRGMQWAASQGEALYFADRGNNQAQRYGDPAGSTRSFKLDLGGSGSDNRLLNAPVDVAVDSAGFLYVVDAGNQRVLRYDSEGGFVQRVDWNLGKPQDNPLILPVAVAADNRQVFVADRGAGRVWHYWRLD
jgi:hypothetical protein